MGVLGAEGGGAEGENGASDEDGLDGGWEGEEGRAAGGGSEDEDYFSDALDQAGVSSHVNQYLSMHTPVSEHNIRQYLGIVYHV